MKICVISPQLPLHEFRGAEILTYHMIKEWIRRGHHVVAIVIEHPDYGDYAQVEGLHIYFLRGLHKEDFQELESRFLKEAVRKFKALDQIQPFDIVYIFGDRGYALCRQKFNRSTNAKLVFSTTRLPYCNRYRYKLDKLKILHASDTWLRKLRAKFWIFRAYIRFYMKYELHLKEADGLILVNEANYKLARLIYPFFNKSMIYRVPYGANTKLFCLRERDIRDIKKEILPELIDKEIIFFAAWLNPTKGQHNLIQAMSGVVKTEPRAHLVLCGNGPYREKLENLIKILNLQDHVSIYPAVEYNKLPLYMNAASLFVNPAIYYGADDVITREAMASERVILTSCGGVKLPFFEDGKNCVIFKYNNPEDLAKKIIYALNQPQKWREKIGRQARKDVVQKFSIEAMGRGMEHVFHEVLKNG